MRDLHVAVSAASSFTGAWLCRELGIKGYKVSALFSGEERDYIGLHRRRLALLEMENIKCHFNLKVERGDYDRWIKSQQPNVWIHHHHHMVDFRSANYDLQAAHRIGINPLTTLTTSLKSYGCRLVIYSGSYFEPGEGGPRASLPTPYAISKSEVWLKLWETCKLLDLPIAKVVIPNPIGPLENDDRMIPLLIKASRHGSAFTLTTPNSSAVNLPIDILVKCYLDTIENFSAKKRGEIISRPSVPAETNNTFVGRVLSGLIAQELRLSPCRLNVTDNEGPVYFRENGSPQATHYDWKSFWQRYAKYEGMGTRETI